MHTFPVGLTAITIALILQGSPNRFVQELHTVQDRGDGDRFVTSVMVETDA